MALTEQQNHLQQVIQQQQGLLQELQTLNTQVNQKQNMATKLQGIIEYLNGIGVTLPEPEVGVEGEGGDETASVTPEVDPPAAPPAA